MPNHSRLTWIRLKRMALVLVTLLTMTAAAPASIRIQVKVTDCATGFPINGAAVRVPTSQLKIDKTIVYTSSNGIATIYPVKPGDMVHRVEVSAYPYEMKSVSQFIGEDTYLELRICLDKITTPTAIPTKTVTPSPTVVSTVDVASLASACSAWIATKINAALPGLVDTSFLGGSTTSEKITSIAKTCQADLACASTAVASEMAASTATLLIQSGATPESALQFIGSLFEPTTSTTCAETNHLVLELVKTLSIQGLNLSVVLLDPLTNGTVGDQQGRQSGFLDDSSTVQDIPGSLTIRSEQANAIILPASQLGSLNLMGNAQSMATLEVIHTIAPFVLEVSFHEIALPEQAMAELVFNGLMAELVVNEAGATKRISPTQLNAFEITQKEQITQTATSEPTQPPVYTPSPAPETNLPFSLPCGTISAPILLGMLLLFRKSKQSQP